jgi:peroxiredoxin Q/BCP
VLNLKGISGFEMLKIGDSVPDFDTTTESDVKISSKELLGKKYVLYFYPRDNTPGCIKEACSIRDSFEIFQNKSIQVYGISGGTANSHQKFINKFNLPFPLLMDPELKIARKFGAYKKGNRVLRITFLIDENGKIEGIFGGPNGLDKVKTTEHAEQILEFWI